MDFCQTKRHEIEFPCNSSMEKYKRQDEGAFPAVLPLVHIALS